MTKVTTASVRIMISHNYSNFEVTMNLENAEGVSVIDIENARSECQSLVNSAVNEYKSQPSLNPKKELQRIENKIHEIKEVLNPEPKSEFPESPQEVAEIMNLPTWEEKKHLEKASEPEKTKRKYNKKA
jgi:hypothetical protein